MPQIRSIEHDRAVRPAARGGWTSPTPKFLSRAQDLHSCTWAGAYWRTSAGPPTPRTLSLQQTQGLASLAPKDAYGNKFRWPEVGSSSSTFVAFWPLIVRCWSKDDWSTLWKKAVCHRVESASATYCPMPEEMADTRSSSLHPCPSSQTSRCLRVCPHPPYISDARSFNLFLTSASKFWCGQSPEPPAPPHTHTNSTSYWLSCRGSTWIKDLESSPLTSRGCTFQKNKHG